MIVLKPANNTEKPSLNQWQSTNTYLSTNFSYDVLVTCLYSPESFSWPSCWRNTRCIEANMWATFSRSMSVIQLTSIQTLTNSGECNTCTNTISILWFYLQNNSLICLGGCKVFNILLVNNDRKVKNDKI